MLYLGKATARQKIELYRRFFSESSESEAEAFVEMYAAAETMAEFQGLLLGLGKLGVGWFCLGCYAETMIAPARTSQASAYSGLCEDCCHSRRIESDRGSVFFLCQLASTDSRFKKYPRLPVLSCVGYERKTESSV